MTRLRTVTLLMMAGLFMALLGPMAAASVTGTSTPSVQASALDTPEGGRHCC